MPQTSRLIMLKKTCVEIQLNLNFFFFLLDTSLEKPGSNLTLTAAETTQSLTSEDHPLTRIIED